MTVGACTCIITVWARLLVKKNSKEPTRPKARKVRSPRSVALHVGVAAKM